LWSEILLIVSAAISSIWLIFYSGRSLFHINLFLTIPLIAIIICFAESIGFNSVTQDVTGWSMVTGVTALLVSISMIIRHLKPGYARYPYAFSFSPAVILIFYPFMTEAGILKDLFNQILQGGALLIAFLMIISLFKKLKRAPAFAASVLLLGMSYSFYWFDSINVTGLDAWFWQSTLSGGVILATASMSELLEGVHPE
jgi:hypothetical protein